MTDPLPSLDLRLTPDWLKESETGNRYADYEGDDQPDRHHRGRRDRKDDRPRRPASPNDRSRQDRSDRRPAANTRPSVPSSGRGPSPSASARTPGHPIVPRRRPGKGLSEATDNALNARTRKRLTRKLSRLRSRSIFSLKNAHFQKSSNRLNRGISLTRYLALRACFSSGRNAIGSVFARSITTR